MDQQLGYFTTNAGDRIAYSVVGEGPALIQAGPRPGHLTVEWEIDPIRQLYQALARNFTVIRYDSLGGGLSDWQRSDFSLATEIALLEQLVDTVGVTKFSLLGSDVGGLAAIACAQRRPERIHNLILFGTCSNGKEAMRGAVLPSALRALMLDHWALAARLIANIWAPDADGATYQTLASLMFRACSGDNAVRICDELLYNTDVTELLPEVKAPTTVIHRAHDCVYPYTVGRELAQRIPDCRFVALEGTSHSMFVGNTDSLISAIERAMYRCCESQTVELAAASGYARNGAPLSLLQPSARLYAINDVSPDIQSLPQPEFSRSNGFEIARQPAPLELEDVGAVASTISCVRISREGDYWSIGCDNGIFRLRDCRGLNYLVQLLRYPNRDFRATELEARSESRRAEVGIVNGMHTEDLVQAGLHSGGPGDAGPMLDTRAKAEYRRRLHELQNQLEEAKLAGNERKAAETEQELEFLAHELSRAVGLGGRDRRSASDLHRARVNVSRAVRRTIAKIRNYDSQIANVLTLTVKLGIVCVYRRDLGHATTFQV
jgi:pimeloyl-ACP methyl ester carboxylesterase